MRTASFVAVVMLLASSAKAAEIADGISVDGYLDLRAFAPTDQTSWLKGGLGKFRYGDSDGNARAAEAVLQASARLTDGLTAVTVLRLEPETPSGIDALETYLRYAPAADGDVSWSVKAGAFFPTLSLENDDLGWTSPYTLTPSAINSWVGDELRSIGSEATLRWKTGIGTVSAIGAVVCCNDEAGILMADRGWSMDDRPTGLFERVRLPDATLHLFHAPLNTRTGLFDEIDGHPGWYAGLNWQAPGVVKLSVLRYDNDADPAAVTSRDTAWKTGFWSFGARTNWGPLVLIAQALTGRTAVVSRGNEVPTKFQSAYLLGAYDWDDVRFSLREDLFQTRHIAATPSPLSEDGDATTAAISWSGRDWLRLTGEVIAMNSRRGEYVSAGLGSPKRQDVQVQFDARFSP